MAISSIHIEAGKMGFFGHNDRSKKTKNSIFSDEENFTSCSNQEAIKLFKDELAIRSKIYTERTGRKIHKNTLTHLSAIVNLNQHHNTDDLKKVCDYLESTFDTKIIQYSIHRDEGHVAEDGEKIKNYHAHIEMMGLDTNGASVRKKLGRKELSQMQTAVAKLLQMERGINYSGEMKERPTRLGTYEYKQAKEDETKTVQAKSKDLKAEIAQLRAELQASNAVRADYAKLEQLNKQLKEQIKSHSLSTNQLQDQVLQYQDAYNTLQGQNKALEAQKHELSHDIDLLAREYDFNYSDWKKREERKYDKRVKARRQ